MFFLLMFLALQQYDADVRSTICLSFICLTAHTGLQAAWLVLWPSDTAAPPPAPHTPALAQRSIIDSGRGGQGQGQGWTGLEVAAGRSEPDAFERKVCYAFDTFGKYLSTSKSA